MLVIDAIEQNSWPMAEMPSTTAAHPLVSAWVKMDDTAPPAAVTPASSCTAKRNDSSRIQPPMAE